MECLLTRNMLWRVAFANGNYPLSVAFVSVHCMRRAVFPTPQLCFRRVITHLISPVLGGGVRGCGSERNRLDAAKLAQQNSKLCR